MMAKLECFVLAEMGIAIGREKNLYVMMLERLEIDEHKSRNPI
jgi:hypothetical protein